MKPTAYMMLGLPGSGKTTYSKELQKRLGIPRYSLDEEYFARVGNVQQEHRDFGIEEEVGQAIRQRLIGVLSTGQSVILDFCPWKKEARDEYRNFLETAGANCHIFYFDVSKQELINRLERRNNTGDPNHQYMTPQMLEDFFERFDPPAGEEVEIITSG